MTSLKLKIIIVRDALTWISKTFIIKKSRTENDVQLLTIYEV